MYEIKYKFPDRVYQIYRRDEADEAGIEYKHWKGAGQGEWALSDDGYVLQVIKRDVLPYLSRGRDKPVCNSHLFTFPHGRFKWVEMYANTKFKVEGRGKNDPEELERKIRNKFSGNQFRDLALVYSLCWDKDVAIDIVCKEKTFEQKRSIARRMNKRTFQEMVSDRVRDILSDNGINERFVVDLLKESIELAREKRDARTMLSIAQNLESLTGMDEKSKTVETATISLTQKATDLLDRAKTEERKIEASVVKEIDGGARETEKTPEKAGVVEEGVVEVVSEEESEAA